MFRLAVSLAIALAAPAIADGHEPNPKDMEKAFTAIADKAMDSTVAIRTYELIAEGPPRITKSLGHGSGTIISEDGAVLTNAHVVEGADWVVAILHDGTFLDAQIAGVDERGDLALLRLDTERKFTAMTLAEPGSLAAGKWAFAVGNPRGIASSSGRMSFTVGTVSGVGRDMTGEFKDRRGRFYGNMVECDLSVWPGSSGGPLLDLDGKLAGVVTGMRLPGKNKPSVTAFAIPLEGHAIRALRSMLAGEPVKYGFIGAELAELDPRVRSDLRLPRLLKGALVTKVQEGLPAEAAGLLPGDVVVSFKGQPVVSVPGLVMVVGECAPGEVAEMVVVREQEQVSLTVRPSAR